MNPFANRSKQLSSNLLNHSIQKLKKLSIKIIICNRDVKPQVLNYSCQFMFLQNKSS